MRLTTLAICLLYMVGNCIEAVPTLHDPEAAASRQISRWQKQYNKYIEATVQTRKSGCTSDNIVYRQEWGSLSHESRMDYINAVKCLQKKPPLYSKSRVPGARSRFDDFSATHIMQSTHVHFSGLFFFFHRYLTWLYEKALREECSYDGTQPYWDWSLSWQDPRLSTVFDGSPTSMGSNGATIPHGPTNISAFGIDLTLDPGTGGGCVSGPFANYTVNLGPVATAPKGSGNGLTYNPRCLTRDISLEWSNNTKPTNMASLINSCNDLGCFGTLLEALDGVHTGAHFSIGGVASDAYSSTGDPAFYLLHAQVDRLWTIWQNLHPHNRTNQVYGTGTAVNVPPSPNVMLNTSIEVDILGPQLPVRRLISSIDGPFCYMYI